MDSGSLVSLLWLVGAVAVLALVIFGVRVLLRWLRGRTGADEFAKISGVVLYALSLAQEKVLSGSLSQSVWFQFAADQIRKALPDLTNAQIVEILQGALTMLRLSVSASGLEAAGAAGESPEHTAQIAEWDTETLIRIADTAALGILKQAGLAK